MTRSTGVTVLVTLAAISALFCATSCDAALRKPLTDAEVDRLAEQWEEGEEEDPDDPEVEMKRKMEGGGGGFGGKGGGMDLEALKGLSPEEAQQHMGAASSKGQTKMIFVQFNPSVGKQTDMEERMGFFTGQLMNNALQIKAYPIEPLQMMVTIDDGSRSVELIQFFQAQPEIDRLELDQVKHYGVNSWSQQNTGEAAKQKEDMEAKNKVRGDKYQARKAREDALKAEGKDPFNTGLKKKKKKKKTKKGGKKTNGKKTKKKAKSGKADGDL